MRATPSVSVVIPAYNEGAHLRECLQSLMSLDYPRYEIILVDNESTDDTASICADFPQVKYVLFSGKKSSYAARNEGVRHSRGEVIAFFDADQTAFPNYLRLLLADYVPNDPYHVYVGRLTDDPRVPVVLRQFFSWEAWSNSSVTGNIPTCSVAVPRTLFDEFGGFKEEILSGGDYEFFGRVCRVARTHRQREVGGYHYWASDIRDHLLRSERYAFGQCLRARAEGCRPPGIAGAVLYSLWTAVRKIPVACAVPFRYPFSEWLIRWHAQYIHWLETLFHLRGVVAYHQGKARAGDLPAQGRNTAARCSSPQQSPPLDPATSGV